MPESNKELDIRKKIEEVLDEKMFTPMRSLKPGRTVDVQDAIKGIELLIAQQTRQARKEEVNQLKALAEEQYREFETPLAKSIVVYCNSRLQELNREDAK